MGTLVEDLRAFGSELRETHVSRVFLGEREVWKVKKPVSLGFLDFSTVEARRAACEAEVRLNARFSADVYLGVVPVLRGPDGRHRIEGAAERAAEGPAGGEVVDWAVHMRRLPDAWRTDVRLAEGRLGDEDVRRVAERVAAFHQAARADEETARYGAVEVIAGNVRENFAQTRDTVLAHLSAAEARELERWQLDFLEEHRPLFAARARDGRIRDGHGDLRLDQVYLDEGGGVHLLDCIEFNERFRYGDVCADVAFYAMDLAWRGRTDLAERFLAAYARAAGDYDLYALVDFYESYRAYVRGKIAAMLAADRAAPEAVRDRAAEEARRYFLLALAAERRPLVPPLLVAVGGLIASGKSTVSDQLGLALGAPVVDTDRTRKQLWGVESTRPLADRPWSGAYDPAFTERVYAEVFRRAEVVLASGRPVVLDASFRPAALRARARDLSRDAGVPFRFVECRVAAELARARLEERARGRSVSDGRLEIFDDFAARWEPVAELPPEEHFVLDTGLPLERNLSRLRRALPAWPEGAAP